MASHPTALGLPNETRVARPMAALRVPAPLAVPVADPVAEHTDAATASRSQGRLQLAWPAPGIITSPFGDGRGHPGIDIDGVTGDPVVAAAPGIVIGAGNAPLGFSGYGTIVAIDHGNGLSTLYAHLSRVDVATGQVVKAGDLIGAIGMTGIATGDHLHFEVRVKNVPVDPMLWLGPRPARAAAPVKAPARVTAPAPSAPTVEQPRLKTPHPE